ncbi:putative methyltransferase DDB_G0268948 [Ciona intestinalis]
MFRYYESKSITEKYRKYRPSYPPELAKKALRNFTEKKLEFLLDVGCGGGQAVNIFAPFFNKVVAIDPSENQLKEARNQNKFAHVEYKQGVAKNLPCEDDSVDAVTVASALHWFDRPKFYQEVERVLKPGGILIVFSYWSPKLIPICKNDDIENLTRIGSQIVHDAFSFGIRGISALEQIYSHGENKYKQIFSEIPLIKKRRYDIASKSHTWSLDDVKGFVQSIDGYETYMKNKASELSRLSEEERDAKLSELDYSEQVVHRLKETWGCVEMKSSDVKMKAIFNFFVIVGEKSE